MEKKVLKREGNVGQKGGGGKNSISRRKKGGQGVNQRFEGNKKEEKRQWRFMGRKKKKNYLKKSLKKAEL